VTGYTISAEFFPTIRLLGSPNAGV
jgi:hypothetical protein